MSFIQISNLTFSYPGGLEPVFKDFDIRLDTSWKLALVGDNGKGKTTLLKLLCGELKGTGAVSADLPFRRFPFKNVDEFKTADEIIYEQIPDAEL